MAGLRVSLLLAAGFAVSAIRLSRRETHLPHFDIDLDQPPRQRWKHMARDTRAFVMSKLDRQRWKHMARDTRAFVMSKLDQMTSEWKNHDEDQLEELKNSINVSDELREEMEGILEELDAPGLTYRDVLFWQMRYELGLTHGFECTAVLMALPNGTMLHGRNLDIPPKNRSDMIESRSLLVDLTFIQGGKPLFRAVGSRGMVGVHNAVRRGGWTVEQNTRHNASIRTRREWLDGIIREAKRGAPVATLAFRQAMQHEATYAGAMTRLRSTLLMTDAYVILSGAGPYEGAVITVKQGSEAMPPWYAVRTLEKKDWFLVQSNDDGGRATNDTRPWLATVLMKRAGQNFSRDPGTRGSTALEQVMRLFPVCNEATIFTWYMSAVADLDYVVDDDCRAPAPKPADNFRETEGDATEDTGSSIPGILRSAASASPP